MRNINFVLSPLAIVIISSLVIITIFSLIIFPIQPVWGNYVKLFAVIFLMGGCAFLVHPPVLRKILSARRMKRLEGVETLRDVGILIAVFGFFSLLLQTYVQIVYVATADLPLADALLNQWDVALGLNWLAYFQWVHDNTIVSHILAYAYNSMTAATSMTMFILVLMKRTDCVFLFVHGFFVTAILCVTIGAFFPAHGATYFMIEDMTQFPRFRPDIGMYGVEVINQLRSASEQIIFDPDKLNGVVTFPSFHTAGTIAICYAWHRTKLRPIAWIYAALVIASTPVVGAHYFVDVFAGLVIGFSTCLLLDRWMQKRWAVFYPGTPLPYSSPVTT